jgi:iron complex transport system ATP-binding protein
MAVLSGYVWASEGRVAVLGQVFGQTDIAALRQRIGLIEPSRMPAFVPSMTVRQLITTGLYSTILLPGWKQPTRQQKEQVERQMEQFRLEKFAQTSFRTLSTGEQTRVLIARALISNPELIIFDEPTVGLDIGSRAEIVSQMDRILEAENNPTLIVVSHHLDELPGKIDNIMLLKDGRIFDKGSPDKMITSRKLSAVYECPVEVVKNGGRYLSSVDLGTDEG